MARSDLSPAGFQPVATPFSGARSFGHPIRSSQDGSMKGVPPGADDASAPKPFPGAD
ncbi:MAG TPA: hypothetical protein VFE63_16735 [Roseiarcus sp.]|nr:hypothetical protein [Roseiarcus sp.]